MRTFADVLELRVAVSSDSHLAVAAVELVEIDKVAEVAGAVAVEVLLLQFVELVAVALGVGCVCGERERSERVSGGDSESDSGRA